MRLIHQFHDTQLGQSKGLVLSAGHSITIRTKNILLAPPMIGLQVALVLMVKWQLGGGIARTIPHAIGSQQPPSPLCPNASGGWLPVRGE